METPENEAFLFALRELTKVLELSDPPPYAVAVIPCGNCASYVVVRVQISCPPAGELQVGGLFEMRPMRKQYVALAAAELFEAARVSRDQRFVFLRQESEDGFVWSLVNPVTLQEVRQRGRYVHSECFHRIV